MNRRRRLSAVTLAIAGSIALAAGIAPLSAPLAAAAPGETDGADICKPPASPTVAQRATVTASYTASWNNIAAVQDGVAVYSGGSNSQTWGTWSSSRPAEQWLQYTWSGEATLTGAALAFWRDNSSDTAGDGVAVPASWKLQYWHQEAWHDIALADGAAYPRAKDATNTVAFAQPVTTTQLRAVFTATTNGTTFAAVGVSDFAVEGDAPAAPGTGLELLSSDDFQLGVSRQTGGIYHLAHTADRPSCTNYVSNPTIRPSFDVDDSRWVGDIGLRVNGTARTTSLSDDIRTVSRDGDQIEVAYTGTASRTNGIRGFDLTETYSLAGERGDVLDWSIQIDNTTAGPLHVQDLTVPMLMNSWWNGGDQPGIYEQNVARHSFVAEDGSYAYWQRPNGEGPFLVMVPKAGTSIEFRDKARTGEGPFGESDPGWEGLIEFAIHSEQLQGARSGKIGGYLPSSSLTLGQGESQTYGFTFRWAKDYADLHDVLYEAGVVDVVSLPGMSIPQDTTATLAVRAKDGIDDVVPGGGLNATQGADARITAKGASADGRYELYEIEFPTLGPNFVTVTYGDGRRSVLQYNSIAPIEELIAARAQFLVDHQQARNTGRGYEGAFLQWDMSREQLITWHDYPGGGWKQWMAGGSDDLGLAPAAFLSERNLDQPDEEQVAAIDYYLEKFIWGYMQTQTENGERTYRIYHWYDGTDGSAPGTNDGKATWRVMNYPHVWNTYFNMYKIATAYPDVPTTLSADEYLMRAYRTMKAYFEHPNVGTLDDASREMGSMGEMTLPEVVEALTAEGHTAEAATLEGFIHAKAEEMLSRPYPFASEMSIDTTAFEAVYTLAKRYGDDAMAHKVTRASIAARGLQPLWYYYGSDNRHMGESWWNLGYETQLGAWQQQDYLRNYDAADAGLDFDEAMRSTYGAYLAGWSNINTGQISSAPINNGAASWQYQSQLGAGEGQWSFMPMINGWWAWSGEADLGFWGALRTASVNVVDDAIVGPYAYGGDLSVEDGAYRITPRDGVRQSLTLYNEGRFGVDLEQARYTQATISDDLTEVELTLESVTEGTSTPLVTLRNLPAGSYDVRVDDAVVTQITSDGQQARVELEGLTGSAHTLRIAPAGSTAAPDLDVAPVTRCVAGKVVLAVSATNGESEPLSVAFTTPYGSKSLLVDAGKTTSFALSTRAVSIPAGEVTASVEVDGQPVALPAAPYEEKNCG
ncbi:MAG TPA: DUF5695 domain-containing protein [Arachnia sp.]|nr:DUF5695 domain-containing protein [Arachnia sp.]HMT86987.1 DUF5695 domain-containing protein [Arachnia sp.]